MDAILGSYPRIFVLPRAGLKPKPRKGKHHQDRNRGETHARAFPSRPGKPQMRRPRTARAVTYDPWSDFSEVSVKRQRRATDCSQVTFCTRRPGSLFTW